MANVQNNSNANSSLVNTMLGSDSLMNENVYSTAMINPPHALTYSPMDPSNGSVVADGSTTSFQINKYGIISQILFSYEKVVTRTDAGTANIDVNDIFAVIDKVELLSSSRVISTLTRYDLMSQFSALPQDHFTPIDEGCVKEKTGAVAAAGGGSVTHKFTIPLVFGFMLKQNTQLNASFLEPLSIKVYYGKIGGNISGGTATAVVNNPKLMVRYKNYQEEAVAKILAENYSNPTLNMLLCRYYDENRSSLITVANTDAQEVRTLQVELKNTDCVEDFYFVLVKSALGSSATVPGDYTDFTPQPITNLKFTGSGQEFCNLDVAQLNYGRIGSYGFSHALSQTTGGSNLARIKTFQTGIYDDHVVSNTLSLREINNPLVEVTFLADNGVASTGTNPTFAAQYSLYVVEKATSIYSVNSATGSLAISLSN